MQTRNYKTTKISQKEFSWFTTLKLSSLARHCFASLTEYLCGVYFPREFWATKLPLANFSTDDVKLFDDYNSRRVTARGTRSRYSLRAPRSLEPPARWPCASLRKKINRRSAEENPPLKLKATLLRHGGRVRAHRLFIISELIRGATYRALPSLLLLLLLTTTTTASPLARSRDETTLEIRRLFFSLFFLRFVFFSLAPTNLFLTVYTPFGVPAQTSLSCAR